MRSNLLVTIVRPQLTRRRVFLAALVLTVVTVNKMFIHTSLPANAHPMERFPFGLSHRHEIHRRLVSVSQRTATWMVPAARLSSRVNSTDSPSNSSHPSADKSATLNGQSELVLQPTSSQTSQNVSSSPVNPLFDSLSAVSLKTFHNLTPSSWFAPAAPSSPHPLNASSDAPSRRNQQISSLWVVRQWKKFHAYTYNHKYGFSDSDKQLTQATHLFPPSDGVGKVKETAQNDGATSWLREWIVLFPQASEWLLASSKADVRDQFSLIGVKGQVKAGRRQAAGEWHFQKPATAGRGVEARRVAMAGVAAGAGG